MVSVLRLSMGVLSGAELVLSLFGVGLELVVEHAVFGHIESTSVFGQCFPSIQRSIEEPHLREAVSIEGIGGAVPGRPAG